MDAAELRKRLDRFKEPRPRDSSSVEARRLEVMAAERDVSRFLAGKNPPSDLAALRLAEIIVRDRLPHEEVGMAFVADPTGFEFACRNPLQRLRFRLDRALSRAFG
jgi:hypothetical protein